jgi:hypothetical protein
MIFLSEENDEKGVPAMKDIASQHVAALKRRCSRSVRERLHSVLAQFRRLS